MSRGPKAGGGRGQLRIIGGEWRGRKLAFPDIEGLRPTTDRVRETLFNWLTPHIHGARCLDLFAGSGALGLEALSRGASHCSFVDSSRKATAQIQDHLQTLAAADRGICQTASAISFLAGETGPWNIVFLDPPFGHDLVAPCCELLDTSDCLAAESRVYIESAAGDTAQAPGDHCELYRHKRAGNVSYQLFIVHAR